MKWRKGCYCKYRRHLLLRSASMWIQYRWIVYCRIWIILTSLICIQNVFYVHKHTDTYLQQTRTIFPLWKSKHYWFGFSGISFLSFFVVYMDSIPFVTVSLKYFLYLFYYYSYVNQSNKLLLLYGFREVRIM